MKTLTVNLALTLLLVACGRSNVAALKDDLVPTSLRVFPAQDQRFVNNKWFLWKKDMTPAEVATALSISREIDDLDSEALPLNRHYGELQDQLAPLADSLKQYNAEFTFDKQLFDERGAALATLNQKKKDDGDKLAAELAKPVADQDAQTVQSLQRGLAIYDALLADTNKVLAKLKPRVTILQSRINTLNKNIVPIQSQLDLIEPRRRTILETGRERVSDIMKVVDWYADQPSAISFHFNSAGKLEVIISNWGLDDGAGNRTFTSTASDGTRPTIGNATYDEKGGIYDFDAYVFADAAQTQLRETYHFHLARTKYDYPDGRIFLGGEITRTGADGESRRGVAQCVDRNN